MLLIGCTDAETPGRSRSGAEAEQEHGRVSAVTVTVALAVAVTVAVAVMLVRCRFCSDACKHEFVTNGKYLYLYLSSCICCRSGDVVRDSLTRSASWRRLAFRCISPSVNEYSTLGTARSQHLDAPVVHRPLSPQQQRQSLLWCVIQYWR